MRERKEKERVRETREIERDGQRNGKRNKDFKIYNGQFFVSFE